MRGWVCGSVGVILGHWFLELSECSLCGSVLMLAGQVPVCDLSPQPLSQWGSLGVNTNIVQQEPSQLSTCTCSEQGAPLTLPEHWQCLCHTQWWVPRHWRACACQLRSNEPYPQIQILLTALSVLWEVKTVFACCPSENLCSDFSAYLLPLKTLHCLKSGAQVWRWDTCVYFSVICTMVLGWKCKCHTGRTEWAPSAQGHSVAHTILFVWETKPRRSESSCTDAAVWDSAAKII